MADAKLLSTQSTNLPILFHRAENAVFCSQTEDSAPENKEPASLNSQKQKGLKLELANKTGSFSSVPNTKKLCTFARKRAVYLS